MENSNNKFIVLEGIFDGDAQSIYREMEGIMRAVHSKEANNKTSEWLLSFGEISITGKDFTPKGTISGVVANRFPDQRLNWDAATMRVTNVPDANALIRRSYREGFEVEGLS